MATPLEICQSGIQTVRDNYPSITSNDEKRDLIQALRELADEIEATCPPIDEPKP